MKWLKINAASVLLALIVLFAKQFAAASEMPDAAACLESANSMARSAGGWDAVDSKRLRRYAGRECARPQQAAIAGRSGQPRGRSDEQF